MVVAAVALGLFAWAVGLAWWGGVVVGLVVLAVGWALTRPVRPGTGSAGPTPGGSA